MHGVRVDLQKNLVAHFKDFFVQGIIFLDHHFLTLSQDHVVLGFAHKNTAED